MREALLLKERMDRAVIEKEKESLMVNLANLSRAFLCSFKNRMTLFLLYSDDKQRLNGQSFSQSSE